MAHGCAVAHAHLATVALAVCGEQHVAHVHSVDVEFALPHGALPGEVAVFLRRQRRQRLLGDAVAVRYRDVNGPLPYPNPNQKLSISA